MISLYQFISSKTYRFNVLNNIGVLNLLSDKQYLKKLFKIVFEYELDLTNPKTFNEKLQWLKLYDRNPLYSIMVDKYAAKEYVANIIGEEHIIPTLGVWETPDDIDFDILPTSFVLKCTHDSAGLIIVKNKNNLDRGFAKKKLRKCLNRNYYYFGREWPYKNVKPRIIAEEYMKDSLLSDELTDYKFYCFNGVVDCVMVCYDRQISDTKFYFFDKKWNLKRINKRGKEAPQDFTLPKPVCFEEMILIAERLSKNIPFVRVDLYQSDNCVYFGELTFFPQSGFDKNYLPETDLYFGRLIEIRKEDCGNNGYND